MGAVASECVGCFSSCEITIPVPPVLPGPPPTRVLKRSGAGASVGVAVGTGDFSWRLQTRLLRCSSVVCGTTAIPSMSVYVCV